MPGIFNVPQAGLENVNLDEITAAAYAAGREQGRDNGATRIIERLKRVAPPSWASAFATILDSDRTISAAERLTTLLEQIPNDRTRRRVLKQVSRELRAETRQRQGDRHDMGRTLEGLKRVQAVGDDLFPWLTSDLKLERPHASNLHKFADALRAGDVFDFLAKNATMSADAVAGWTEFAEASSVFLVEHHWSAAFANAGDVLADVEIRLPDEMCAFEFRLSGRHIIAFAGEADGRVIYQMALASGDRWALFGRNAAGDRLHDQLKIYDIVEREIRAIAIALDAQVAVTETVRAPEALNRSRARAGKTPLFSYHVVSLARRSRAAPLARDEDAEPGTRKRLHFRRGHWRHYGEHKTWINWMLVGDPDLGWVDKEYRL